MKKIFLLPFATLIAIANFALADDSATEPPLFPPPNSIETKEITLSIFLTSSSCIELKRSGLDNDNRLVRGGISCLQILPFNQIKKIVLAKNYSYGCPSPIPPETVVSCAWAWEGHWIDFIKATNGQRYIGIVNVREEVIPSERDPNAPSSAYFKIVAEILGPRGGVAKMSTNFVGWNNLPSAVLEHEAGIQGEQDFSKVSLSVSHALVLEPGSVETIPKPDNPKSVGHTLGMDLEPKWTVQMGKIQM